MALSATTCSYPSLQNIILPFLENRKPLACSNQKADHRAEAPWPTYLCCNTIQLQRITLPLCEMRREPSLSFPSYTTTAQYTEPKHTLYISLLPCLAYTVSQTHSSKFTPSCLPTLTPIPTHIPPPNIIPAAAEATTTLNPHPPHTNTPAIRPLTITTPPLPILRITITVTITAAQVQAQALILNLLNRGLWLRRRGTGRGT